MLNVQIKRKGFKMIELKTYTMQELSEILGSRGKQGIDNKLNSWGIAFTSSGRGNQREYTITAIENPFKIYCLTELNFDIHTDFTKALNFFYRFFNDEEFAAMPDEVKEQRMRAMQQDISRQTIANYIGKLNAKNFLTTQGTQYVYYFAYKHHQRMTDKEEYCKAWRECHQRLEKGMNWSETISIMRNDYGGVARKQAIPEINGIYLEEYEKLNALICQQLNNEIDSFNSDY